MSREKYSCVGRSFHCETITSDRGCRKYINRNGFTGDAQIREARVGQREKHSTEYVVLQHSTLSFYGQQKQQSRCGVHAGMLYVELNVPWTILFFLLRECEYLRRKYMNCTLAYSHINSHTRSILFQHKSTDQAKFTQTPVSQMPE